MKTAINMIRDIVPAELLVRLDSLPAAMTDYTEPGFSLSLLKRPIDRLNMARQRAQFAETRAVKQNLAEIIALLEKTTVREKCPVWQGYFVAGTVRIEFVLAPALSRRVVATFDIA